MKIQSAFVLLSVFFAALSPLPFAAQAPDPGIRLGGLVSLFSSGRFESPVEPLLGLRFIPEVKFSLAVGNGVMIDSEASANCSGSLLLDFDKSSQFSGDVKPYRAWIRFSTSRFEARAGLQKVSFGSASLFRPMMWFDSLDPRDPLQLTDGVTALLLRYYTKGNANVWAWAMYGNNDQRGWDLAPPNGKTPEFGGRIQIPLLKGEIGATYHFRKAAIDGLRPVPPPLHAPLAPFDPVPEERFGLDGKWDLGFGFWLEGSLVRQKTALLPLPYQLALNAGLDYTFGLGNGLTALAEHFRFESSPRAFTRGESLSLSALFLRYPIGLLDEVSGIFYLDWKNRNIYRFLTWRRTFDAFSVNVILYWNPKELLTFPGQPGSSSFAGKGFQLFMIYHF